MASKILAIDLGGTKAELGVVTDRGRIVESTRFAIHMERGKKAVLQDLIREGQQLLKRHPEVKTVGLASAGPLDPNKGLLLDPTNFHTPSQKGWGIVPITQILSKAYGRPVTLDNDAAAAMLAEHWLGAARKTQNAMILTLGTGLGTGILCNGSLVRAGRHLHPEAGHIILRAGDRTARCGCGNLGCAEAYLSGNGFTRRVRALWSDRAQARTLDAPAIAALARKGNREAKRFFAEYAQLLAVAIQNYSVLYAPEIVVFSGSFAQASDLFFPATRIALNKLMGKRKAGIDLTPKLVLSQLENHAGLLGAAYLGI